MNIQLDWISISALFISFLALITSCVFSYLQMVHNRNSVIPIAVIEPEDYQERVAVRFDNVGTGPLIIKEFTVEKEGFLEKSLVQQMPYGINWTTFAEELDGRTIPVGGSIKLIEVESNDWQEIEKIRVALKDCIVKVKYTDVYRKEFIEVKKLDYFGRQYR